jgi:hypothetical protein
VEYNQGLAKLVTPPQPSYRIQLNFNRIRPKVRARLSKFFKGRPRPTVIPASTSYQDQLNARGTEKVLSYHWDRLHLEELYKDARLWATIGSKAYWAFSIDESAFGRIQQEDPITGATTTEDVQIGDVLVEVVTPFEILVADPAISRIGNQPWIQRVRMIDVEDAQQRYPEHLADLEGGKENSSKEPISQYADRLAQLKPGNTGGTDIKRGSQVLMIEEFTAPCAKYPKGRYAVLIESKLCKLVEELPYRMYDHKVNPYPFVEFADSMTPGQFWGTTLVEQLIDLQRQYNYLFELITENVRAVSRPKLVVYKQHNLPDGAYTTAPGEILEPTYVPGVPAPFFLQPASIAGDAWNLIQYYDRLFDELTQIYPASEGKVASSSSGFQTNLLQEATDTVHAPDVREDELTLQEAAWKIRRLCKLWYDVPRLIVIGGDASLPEMLEFAGSQVDEFAEVRIQAGSMLPEMKAAKAQTALELYKSGLFGDMADPQVRRRTLSMLEMGGLEVVREEDRIDIDSAQLEQVKLSKGKPVPPAQFIHDHIVHIVQHQTFMKSPAFEPLAPEAKAAVLAHVIGHYDFVNPMLAQSLRLQYQALGMMDLPVASPPPIMPPAPIGPDGQPLGPPGPGVQAPPPAPNAPPPQ